MTKKLNDENRKALSIDTEEDIKWYTEKLEYLKECNPKYYDMVTTIIEMSVLLPYDITDYDENLVRNTLIRNIAMETNERRINILKGFINGLKYNK